MKTLSSVAIAALLAVTLSAQAQQRSNPEDRVAAAQPKAVGGPLKIIYRVSGVRDSGGGDRVGIATAFHCTSASTVNETLRIGVRNNGGAIVGTQQTVTIPPNQTITMSTHDALVFSEDRVLTPAVLINQGSAHIMATSNKIFCSAMIVDCGGGDASRHRPAHGAL